MAVSVSCVETGYSVARQGGQGEVMCVMVWLGAVGRSRWGKSRLSPLWSGLAIKYKQVAIYGEQNG